MVFVAREKSELGSIDDVILAVIVDVHCRICKILFRKRIDKLLDDRSFFFQQRERLLDLLPWKLLIFGNKIQIFTEPVLDVKSKRSASYEIKCIE